MSHPNDDTRSAAAGKPTLEALLRLKRAERPDAAFWQDFERGLRQKQLAAIIEPKPWWLEMALWSRRLAPVGLPVSGAAAALLAIMIVRTQSPFVSVSAPVEFGPAISAGHSTAAANPKAPSSVAAPVLTPHADVAVASVVSPAPSVPASPQAASEVAAIVSPSGTSETPVVESLLGISPAPAVQTPSELTIADNLAEARAESPEFISHAVDSLQGVALSTASADTPAADTSLKMEVRNPRHARVLLAMADHPSVDSSGGLAHLRDRLAHSLDNDDALSGSASRLGVGGDRLSVSF